MSEQASSRSEWTGDAAVDDILDVVHETALAVRDGLPERRAYVDRENPSGERIRAADEIGRAHV